MSIAVGLKIEEKVVGKNGKEKIKVCPTVTFHTFRHNCVSLLLDDGRNIKQVQEWLGHADPDFAPLTEGGQNLGGPVTIGADAVGLVGLSTFFRERDPGWDITDEIDLMGFVGVFVRRTIEIPALLLETASLLGRVRVHLWIFGMSRLLRISADDVTLPSVVALPSESEITLPTSGEELAGIAREAVRAYGREAGVETFE